MVSVNPLTREIQLKVVYYGPGLGGKTTTLQHIHDTTDPKHRGNMVSLATPVERTLYFDYLPVTLPKIGGYTLKLQLFTVPGQIHFNATRKLVLSNSDGVVFVADSQRNRLDANLESYDNLAVNLREYKVDLDEFPLLIQYNKRDLDDIMSIEALDRTVNKKGRPAIGTSALQGENVYLGLEMITKDVLRDLKRRNVLGVNGPERSGMLNAPAFVPKEDPAIRIGKLHARSAKGGPLPLEDAVSRITEHKPSITAQAIYSEAASMGENTDRPTIPAPLALTEKAVSEKRQSDFDRASFERSGPSGTRFTFLPFWPEAAKRRALEIEQAISDGRLRDAMRLIASELDLIISVHGRGMPRASKRTIVAMLGFDDQLYLEIYRASRATELHLSHRSVLGAYLFLLQLVDRSR
jgi:mutual gliding-motility protein MglA